MKFTRKAIIVTFSVSAISGLALFGYGRYKQYKAKRYNILILSTCSLSASRLGLYNPDAKTSRNVNALAKNSFIFQNAITDMSWSNVSGFLSRIPSSHLKKNGYHAIGRPWTEGEADWQGFLGQEVPQYYMRIPNFERSTRNQSTKYKEDLAEVQQKILDKKNWPFLLEVHNKIIHLPYSKKMGEKNNYPALKLMSPESLSYIKEYQETFESFPERIPFSFFVIERGKALTEAVIRTLKLDEKAAAPLRESLVSPTFIGILNNPEILANWKKSKYFEMDLKIIKETYDKIIQFYDKSVGKLLKLYNDKDLADNTVIIFTGDHGEAFLEHDYMVHGETVYDEMIRFPLFIKFPGQTKGKRLSQQFYQQGIAKIVEKIIAGEINEDNFEEFIVKENNHPLIYSRNCANNIKSLRYKNEWKYMVNLKNDQKFLFDLTKDPGEKINVYDAHPEISSYLEENLYEVAEKQDKNKMLHRCSPESE